MNFVLAIAGCLAAFSSVAQGTRIPIEDSPTGAKAVCGGIDQIVLGSIEDHGFISSPGYPGSYPDLIISGNDCGSSLVVGNSSMSSVLLGFLQMRMGNGDYLSVRRTTLSPPSEETEQYTGSHDLFMPNLTSANEATVYLQSDAVDSRAGFLAAYAGQISYTNVFEVPKTKPVPESSDSPQEFHRIKIDTETGAVSTSEHSKALAASTVDHVQGRSFGFIMSPNHPNNYDNNLLITFELRAPAGSRIGLRMLRMDVEACCDYITLYPTTGPTTTVILSSLREDLIYTTSNEIDLVFRSDSSNTRTGFLISYATIAP